MATDGPDPKPCNKKIYEHGKIILITAGIPSNAFDKWVMKIAEASGQPVDWHFAAGHAVVFALGDLKKVRKALEEHRTDLEDTYKYSNPLIADAYGLPWKISDFY